MERFGPGDFCWSTTGLSSRPGRFTIDPRRPVARAIITHSHGDHLRAGSREYWCARPARGLVRGRVRGRAEVHAVEFGETFRMRDISVSLHPAGHILGSAQVRMERGGDVWVVTGDFKRQSDPSCRPFEVVPCHTLVIEATFASPDYRWDPPERVIDDLMAWWERNRAAGRLSILLAYATGKAQRVLAELGARTDRPVLVHPAVAEKLVSYREEGVPLAATEILPRRSSPGALGGQLAIAPPSWWRPGIADRYGEHRAALVSGWTGRRCGGDLEGLDSGFALSDHADWEATLRTVRETGARRVLVTHGDPGPLVGQLRREGIAAHRLEEYLAAGPEAGAVTAPGSGS